MAHFFPALAHSDNIGYFDIDNKRNLMSIRKLMPPAMSKQFLTSLSFDESIHYASFKQEDVIASQISNNNDIHRVFVDCGAFHYAKEKTPKFLKGGFVNAVTAFEQYQRRHLSRGINCDFLLCSPDHIISPDTDDKTFLQRMHFTLTSAELFIDLCRGNEQITPVGVVHGRTMEERAEATRELIKIGFDYLAFGGLVPIARNPSNVLSQLTGSNDINNVAINPESPLGIAKEKGVKTHLFGLNSPDWYRWIKRLEIDSFDGSKLSTEGAANGIIWVENEFSLDSPPKNASKLYQRMKIKNIKRRDLIRNGNISSFEFSEDGHLEMNNSALDYLMSSRCTSKKCPHGPESHNCDPRVTGSIEHNMGRTILNSWTFDSLMRKIDLLYEKSKTSDDKVMTENWAKIEVLQ